MVGLARAGVIVFWHVQPDDDAASSVSGSSLKLLSSAWAFMLMTVLLAVMASPVKRYTMAAAEQLADKAAYAQAVLGEQGGAAARTTRPYDGSRATGGDAPAAKPVQEETSP